MDIFEYELKYKNDPHVFELVTAYKNLEEDTRHDEEISNDLSDKVSELEIDIADLYREKGKKNSNILDSVDQLKALTTGLKKSEIIEDIAEIMQEMEGYADE